MREAQKGVYRLPSPSEDSYTTLRQNTNGNEVSELLYHLPPFQAIVHLLEALSRGPHTFYCGLSGSVSGQRLEVPAWMSDRSLSGHCRSLPDPYLGLEALHPLAKFLEDAETKSALLAPLAA